MAPTKKTRSKETAATRQARNDRRRQRAVTSHDRAAGGDGSGAKLAEIIADYLADGCSSREIADLLANDHGFIPAFTHQTVLNLIDKLDEMGLLTIPDAHPIAKARAATRPPKRNKARGMKAS